MHRRTLTAFFTAALLMGGAALGQDEDPLAGPDAEAPADTAPTPEPEPAPEPEPPPAVDEAPPPPPEEKEELTLSHMVNSHGGQTGFGEIITPNIVRGNGTLGEGIGMRAGFIFQHQDLDLTKPVGGGNFRASNTAQVYVFHAAVGINDMAEISFSLPLVDQDIDSSGGFFNDEDLGFGNPELSAKFKAPIDNEIIQLGLYTRYEIPWAEGNIVRPKRTPFEEHLNGRWELGTTVGAGFGIFSIYTNLAFGLIEGGTQLFHYRFGVALNPTEMFQFTMYYDAAEFEGSVRSVGVWGWNFNVKFESFFVGLGSELLVLGNAIDDLFDAQIGKTAGDKVDLWTFNVMVGATF